MTKATGSSTAPRKADAVIARRAAEIRQHESDLRDVIVEYFRAQDRADAVRADAEAIVVRPRRDADARVARVQERAGREAAELEEQARDAARRCLAAAWLRVGCRMSTHYRVWLVGVSGGDSYFRW